MLADGYDIFVWNALWMSIYIHFNIIGDVGGGNKIENIAFNSPNVENRCKKF